MVPYISFTYFGLSAGLLLPSIVLGLLGKSKSLKWYNFVLALGFIYIIFVGTQRQLIFLIIYTVWQWLLIKGYDLLRQKHSSYWIYIGAVSLSILPLIIDKVLAIQKPIETFGFLGISYLTFKCVQMLIEMRDGQIKSISIWNYLSFLWFFPTITSGPIDRYRRYVQDTEQMMVKDTYKELLFGGFHRIFRGFLYKFIIAYLIKTYVLTLPLLKMNTVPGILCYMYAYSFYLFFDFAGYSAFAIGISYLLGVRTPENFQLPFISRNIKDFWNRWHMTLSFWFRDYVYMRFVLMVARRKWIRNRYILSSAGYAVLFLLMGLWHGLELHYIVYGLYHACLMIGFEGTERLNKRFAWRGDHWALRCISTVMTFHFVCFGFLIFSGRLF